MLHDLLIGFFLIIGFTSLAILMIFVVYLFDNSTIKTTRFYNTHINDPVKNMVEKNRVKWLNQKKEKRTKIEPIDIIRNDWMPK